MQVVPFTQVETILRNSPIKRASFASLAFYFPKIASFSLKLLRRPRAAALLLFSPFHEFATIVSIATLLATFPSLLKY
jgi:hypothetical protein